MSAINAAWLRMDRPTNLTIITSVPWFARPPDWETVGELPHERLVDRFPRFSQRAVEPGIPWSAHLVEASWIEACRQPALMDTTRARRELHWRSQRDAREMLGQTVAAWPITNRPAFA